jgi:hypothetical protein
LLFNTHADSNLQAGRQQIRVVELHSLCVNSYLV